MVGILLSYWGGLFSGATLVSGRVHNYKTISAFLEKLKHLGWWKIEKKTFPHFWDTLGTYVPQNTSWTLNGKRKSLHSVSGWIWNRIIVHKPTWTFSWKISLLGFAKKICSHFCVRSNWRFLVFTGFSGGVHLPKPPSGSLTSLVTPDNGKHSTVV